MDELEKLNLLLASANEFATNHIIELTLGALVLTFVMWVAYPWFAYHLKTAKASRDIYKDMLLRGNIMRKRVQDRVIADWVVEMMEDKCYRGEISPRKKKFYYRQLGMAWGIPDLITPASIGLLKTQIKLRLGEKSLQGNSRNPAPHIPGAKPPQEIKPKSPVVNLRMGNKVKGV